MAGTRRRRSGDNTVSWMTRIQDAGEVLGGQEVEMVGDWKDLRFVVKVVNGSSGVATCDKAKASVLNDLKAVDGGSGVGRVNQWCRVIKERAN